MRIRKYGHDKCVYGKGVVCTSTQIPTSDLLLCRKHKFKILIVLLHCISNNHYIEEKIILHLGNVLSFYLEAIFLQEEQ